ncbi:hypothetical protein [Deinococcus roseus]|uniref:MFS transporter n=1 Tax=Deinococcus roseus TaxID=392414 RepID=A0ABQ2DCL1_9DEIO|nr:hypothetical protein [Deinococcus roseus]GGJ52045.1 hypothetical protein GCM10008938_42550 [Deinococcus roseus]
MSASIKPTVRRSELLRFGVLAVLLLVNIFVAQSSDVVGTSGIVSYLGAPEILWVWAVDNVLMFLLSMGYSVYADRIKREHLTIGLFCLSSVVYLGMYGLFAAGVADWITYPLLLIIGDQQYLIFPMIIWTLANDLFSLSEAKRIFPILSGVVVGGSLLGNLIPALTHNALLSNVDLLAGNAVLMLLGGLFLSLSLKRLGLKTKQDTHTDQPAEILKEGLDFVKGVPVFMHLAVSMLLLGFAFNTLEFHVIHQASKTYQSEDLQVFYGVFRAIRTALLVLLQVLVTTRLLNKVGFKKMFNVMPISMAFGVVLCLFWPGLIGASVGNGLVRLMLEGIDEPTRRTFLGMVPDEKRGRISAFLEGYLYSAGSIVSCLLLAGVMVFSQLGLISAQTASILYLLLALLCAGGALWAILKFNQTYDKSMLNWRLKRRKRTGGVLDDLKL